jgi:hypothetical protein
MLNRLASRQKAIKILRFLVQGVAFHVRIALLLVQILAVGEKV